MRQKLLNSKFTENRFKDLLLKASVEFSDNIALNHPDGILTYKELHTAASEAAQNPSFTSSQVTVLRGNQSIEEYIQIWASMISEKPYLPLNSKFPEDRVTRILETIDLNLGAVTQSISPTKLAYLIFTSGSTGEPKGIPINQNQLLKYSQLIHDLIVPTSDDRILQLFDFSFDLSVHVLALAWPNGAQVCAVPSSQILMAPRYAEDQNITIWSSVPSVVDLCSKAGFLGPNSLPNIRAAYFAGEALTYQAAQIFAAAAPNARILNCWGPTENTIVISCFEVNRDLIKTKNPPNSKLEIMPIGYPLEGVEMAIWNDAKNEFYDHELEFKSGNSFQGEICVCTEQTTSGYINRPDLNLSSFFNLENKRWYRTGDVGTWDDRYGFLYLGRIDRRIKLNGYRIELQDCEAALRKASGVNQCSVIPWPKKENGIVEGLWGFIAGKKLDIEAIKKELKASLPSYMIPNNILLIDEMPLNINGKVDFKSLEKIAGDYLD